MPAQPRAVQRIFGSSLTPASNLAVIGSLAAGAPLYTSDLKTMQQLAQYLAGFNGIDIGNRSPATQDMNSLMFLITSQLAYLLQRGGPPEWDADTTYYPFCTVQRNGGTYTCINNNITSDPAGDSVNWASGLCKLQAGMKTGGSVAVPVDGNGHIIQFNTIITNSYALFNAGTYKYTAPVRGDYEVSAFLQVDNLTGAAGTMEMSLRAVVNSAVIALAQGTSVANPPGSRWYPPLAGVITLAAGDTLEFHLEATDTVNTGNVQVSNGACSIKRI